MNTNEILKIYGTDFKSMTIRLLEEADLISEISRKTGYHPDSEFDSRPDCIPGNEPPRQPDCVPGNGPLRHPDYTRGNDSGGHAFLSRKPMIGIKPNLVSPTPAMFGATTHPEIVSGVIEYLQRHGMDRIMICEGSWVGDKTEEAFDYCGYQTLADQYGVALLDTQKDSFFPADCAGMSLSICSCVKKIDFLINIPVLKGHCQTRVTCALKNMKGLIPNSEKRRFHSLGLHKPIAHLNTCIRQDFIIVDHICGDPDFEDGGNPLIRNCIMAAKDPVLADAYACRILGYQPKDIPYIAMAEQLGVGCADLDTLRLLTITDAPAETQRKDRTTAESMHNVAEITHAILDVDYAIDEIASCSACYSALTDALRRLKEEGLLHRLTEGQNIRFCIGQGYQKADPVTINYAQTASSTEPTRSAEPTVSAEATRSAGQSSFAEPESFAEPASSGHMREQSDLPVCRIGIGNCTRAYINALQEAAEQEETPGLPEQNRTAKGSHKNIPGCPPSEDDIHAFLTSLLS